MMVVVVVVVGMREGGVIVEWMCIERALMGRDVLGVKQNQRKTAKQRGRSS
jgi:hypothetical protein